MIRGTNAVPVAPCRVLIVDDNTDAAESLAQLVRSWGHEVATAHNGHEALALSERFNADIAFLDIGLPGMNGYELAHRCVRTNVIGRSIWWQ